MKKALISGITGQDGSYLAELLLEKGYDVYGFIRRSSNFNTQRIDHIFPPSQRGKIFYGDLTNGIEDIIYNVKPDEIYNLGAQSHVAVSFHQPVYTGEATGISVTHILEAVRQGIKNGILDSNTKFYQASSSEMFGQTPTPEGGYNENSVFTPVSPYGCAKLYAYHMTRAYRMGYEMYATTGILFNHESPRRGPTFVTRKITRGAARIRLGVEDEMELGNLDALRDWGHSKDYVKAIHLIMQQPEAGEYVVATGEQYSVKDFVIAVFDYFKLDWQKHVKYNKSLLRPNEVPNLLGDSSKIRALGWTPKYTFKTLVEEMCIEDMKLERSLLK